MRNVGDALKVVIHVKLVPDKEPNADGYWDTMSVHRSRISPRTDYEYLNSLAPKGYHVVQVRE